MKPSNYFENYAPSELTESYRVLCTPSTFAKSTLLYIQEIGKLKSLKSHTSRRESLDSFLFIIVKSGSGVFTYEEQTYYLNSGDYVFIDCKIPYSHKSSESDPWELMWVHFNGTLMDKYYSYFSQKISSIILHQNNQDELSLSYILEQLIELASQKETDTELLISNLLNELVTKILTFKEIQLTSEESSGTEKKMKRVKNYIDEHFNEKISLDIVAAEFYISKFHMAREFKKAYGNTIVNYIMEKRITKAKELLRFSDMQIEEIGHICGIEDNSYFNKVFRKIEGMTASVYRKKWRGK
jgi:AraC-like DNA-binding protein